MKISIISPAHNEAERIRPFLDSYCSYFAEKQTAVRDVEIIVVVNHSTDATESIVRDYMQTYPFLKLMVEEGKVGKGGALLLGFDQADGDWIGFVDADGATPPDAFMDLIQHLDRAEVIIASRWMPGADVQPPQPLSRRVASRIFNTMVRWMFGFKISDTQCGAKLMKGDALRKVRPDVGITQWAFDVDLLYQFKRHGFRIEEYPTRWHDVSGSKVDVVRASLEMTVALVRLRLIYSPFRFIVKLYDLTLGHWLKRH